MKLLTPNGTYITGTLETIQGQALASHYEPDGTPIWDGETKVYWNGQETVWQKGSRIYLDDGGTEFTLDQLKIVPDDHVFDGKFDEDENVP